MGLVGIKAGRVEAISQDEFRGYFERKGWCWVSLEGQGTRRTCMGGRMYERRDAKKEALLHAVQHHVD